MTKPMLEYERRVPVPFWTPMRREKLRRACWVHSVASYGTLGMLVAVEVLHGRAPAPIMFAWLVLAPLATLVFLPLACVIVLLPIEPTARQLIILGLPYATMVLLMVWRKAQLRTHEGLSARST